MLPRILLGIAGLVLLGALAIAVATGGRYMLSGQKAVGIVVAIGEDDGMLFPVVEYTTRGGETRRHKGLGAGESDYRVGEGVAIRYFEDDPTASVISSSFQEMWLAAVVVAVVGAVLLGTALLMRRMDRPRRR